MLKLPYRSCIFLSWTWARARRLQTGKFWMEKLVNDKLLPEGVTFSGNMILIQCGQRKSIGTLSSMKDYYLQMLSKNDADIGSETYQTPEKSLQYAGAKGDLWLIMYFLRKHSYTKGEKISIYSPHYESFLEKAIENGHVHIVEYFLDNLHISLK